MAKRSVARSLSQPAGLKWNRPAESSTKNDVLKGNKPVPDPITIGHVMLAVLMYLCRRFLLREATWRVAVCCAVVFVGSLWTDFVPFPRSYFSNKRNFLNQYFVKLGWGWTMALLGTFMGLTSRVYCCGDWRKVARHLGRLAICTAMWLTCIFIFGYVENITGYCNAETEKYLSREGCAKKGHRWHGFDISGHTFLLIYCGLVINEEVKCMRGWERIGELIRNKEFDEDSPLKVLADAELQQLKVLYGTLGGYVKGLFVALTALNLLWDLMLLCTVIYFHTMPQKLAGALFAFLAWYLTYRVLFPNSKVLWLPGQGPFKYASDKASLENRRVSLVGVKPLTRPPLSRTYSFGPRVCNTVEKDVESKSN